MNKHFKKLTAGIIVAAMVTSVSPVNMHASAKKNSKKPVLTVKATTLSVGKSKTIKVKNRTKKVKWSTSNKKIVSISSKKKTSCKIKALKEGKATITAKVDNKKLKCKVTVEAVAGPTAKPTVKPTTKPTTKPASSQPAEFTTKKFTAYTDGVEIQNDIHLSFLKGGDIPYISLEEFVRFTNTSVIRDAEFTLTENSSGSVLEEKIRGIKYIFTTNAVSVTGHDYIASILTKYTPDYTGNAVLKTDGKYIEMGGSFKVDMKKYNICTYVDDAGKRYIPFNTIADIIYSELYITVAFNGDNVFILNYGQAQFKDEDGLTELGKLYYAKVGESISRERIQFNYDELCLFLDTFYGLKSEHGITDFDTTMEKNGTKQLLLSDSARERNKGYAKLFDGDIGDIHSALGDTGNYLEPEYAMEDRREVVFGNYIPGSLYDQQKKYLTARKNNYNDGQGGELRGYVEVGDTAYITFDGFYTDGDKNFYANENTDNMDDLLELIIYANKQLYREGCPVKNLVVDISNNTGGLVFTNCVLLSWLNKKILPTYQINTLTKSKIKQWAYMDANLDGTVGGEGDFVPENIRTFCFISPVSFSCGNLCPTYLKSTTECTLIGKVSGGGSNVVLPGASSEGTIFQTSSHVNGTAVVKNGSYYTSDRGVEPDIYISDIAHLYDREYMTELIDKLP